MSEHDEAWPGQWLYESAQSKPPSKPSSNVRVVERPVLPLDTKCFVAHCPREYVRTITLYTGPRHTPEPFPVCPEHDTAIVASTLRCLHLFPSSGDTRLERYKSLWSQVLGRNLYGVPDGFVVSKPNDWVCEECGGGMVGTPAVGFSHKCGQKTEPTTREKPRDHSQDW